MNSIVRFDNFENKDVKFSKEFLSRYKENITSFKKIFLEKLKIFDYYYSNYDLTGVRIINGIDVYSSAIKIYNKIINKELYVDIELSDPDNSLRNVIMLLEIDKFKFVLLK